MQESRKLASIRRIKEILPIKDADKIELLKIDGWQVVAQKGLYKPNDLIVYYEVDSFLPVKPEYEWLRKSSFRSTQHLGDGFRIKSAKLRNTLSQGIVMPIEEAFVGWDIMTVGIEEGADVTAILDVKKWETPIPPQLAGQIKGNFPDFIPKTDQERIQNIYDDFKTNYGDHTFYGSLKLDGSSMTVYLNEDEFGVCSRNLDLKETEDNTFWRVVRKHKLEELMRAVGRNIALQGELMGPGVQGNREQLKAHTMYLFDVWDIDDQRYLNVHEIANIILDFHGVEPENQPKDWMQICPFVNEIVLENETLESLLDKSNISSIQHSVAEGVVYRSQVDPYISFKVLNNKFLLDED